MFGDSFLYFIPILKKILKSPTWIMQCKRICKIIFIKMAMKSLQFESLSHRAWSTILIKIGTMDVIVKWNSFIFETIISLFLSYCGKECHQSIVSHSTITTQRGWRNQIKGWRVFWNIIVAVKWSREERRALSSFESRMCLGICLPWCRQKTQEPSGKSSFHI